MTLILDIIKGMLIGIANVIPGVSGGTMALSMGVYDKIIGSVSNLFGDFKRSVFNLLPILAGCALGIVGFTYAIEFLLSRHTFVTCMTFVGLILGGVPVLYRSLQEKRSQGDGKIPLSGWLAFLILFAIAVGMPLLNSSEETMSTITATPGTMVLLFLIGIIAAATMVVPGVSGSLVLMILGYYYGIINSLKSFFDALKAFDIPAMLELCLVLVPFGVGVLLGIFLIAKLITFLFERFGVQTYCAIFGLILASPFAIFYNTGLFGQLSSLSAGTVILGAGGTLIRKNTGFRRAPRESGHFYRGKENCPNPAAVPFRGSFSIYIVRWTDGGRGASAGGFCIIRNSVPYAQKSSLGLFFNRPRLLSRLLLAFTHTALAYPPNNV